MADKTEITGGLSRNMQSRSHHHVDMGQLTALCMAISVSGMAGRTAPTCLQKKSSFLSVGMPRR
jgi:hypothetical protein